MRFRTAVWVAAFAAFGVGALVSLLGVELVEVSRQTNFAPPEEFPAAGFLFAHEQHSRNIVWCAAVVFLLSVLILFRDAGSIARLGFVVALTGQVVLPFHAAGSIVMALGLFVVYLGVSTRRLELHPRGDDIARGLGPLVETPSRELLKAWPEILGIPALTMMTVVLLEALFYVQPWTGVGFTTAQLWEYLALTAAAGVIAGVRLGIELALMLWLAREVAGRGRLLRIALFGAIGFALVHSATFDLPAVIGSVVGLVLLDWLLRLRPHPAARLTTFTVLVGLYIWGRTTNLGLTAVGDETAAVNVPWAVHVLFGPFALFMAAWTQSSLARIYTSTPPTSTRETVRAVALSVLTPAGRPGLPIALTFCAVSCWLIAQINYPEFHDFSEVGQYAYSPILLLAVLTAAIAMYTSLPRPLLSGRVGRALIGTLVIVSLAGGWLLSGRSVPRLITFQYSKLARSALREAVPLPSPRFEPASAEPLTLQRQARLPEVPERYRADRPPIFIIVWDAARSDHTSVYGYDRPTTPTAEALAADSVVFEHAYASATATSLSLRHLFSGRHSTRYVPATDHDPFFTGVLLEEGYDQMVINIIGSDFNGVGPGAYTRHQTDEGAAIAGTRYFYAYNEAEKVDAALALLDKRTSDHILMFLHFIAPHFPWHHHDEVPDFGEGYADLYDESIAFTDHYTGRFLAGLRERGLYDNAIIILTADHGTGLAEHGRYGSFQTYEEQLRVPLIFKLPGATPRRVSTPVVGIDIAPTLVSLVRPGAENPYHGHSLAGVMLRGENLQRRYLFSHCAFEDGTAVIDLETQWKLHLHRLDGYVMLYDLANDPGERNNLADEDPARRDTLLEVMLGYLRTGEGVWDHTRPYRAP